MGSMFHWHYRFIFHSLLQKALDSSKSYKCRRCSHTGSNPWPSAKKVPEKLFDFSTLSSEGAKVSGESNILMKTCIINSMKLQSLIFTSIFYFNI